MFGMKRSGSKGSTPIFIIGSYRSTNVITWALGHPNIFPLRRNSFHLQTGYRSRLPRSARPARSSPLSCTWPSASPARSSISPASRMPSPLLPSPRTAKRRSSRSPTSVWLAICPRSFRSWSRHWAEACRLKGASKGFPNRHLANARTAAKNGLFEVPRRRRRRAHIQMPAQ
jgi:hypothetical protein